MVVDVETTPTFRAGRPRVLFEGRYYQQEANVYDIAPDGTRFVMIKADPAESGETHVNVVTNWFEENSRRRWPLRSDSRACPGAPRHNAFLSRKCRGTQ